MSKAYWVSTYRAVKNADKVAAYAKLAGPALTAEGGRFLSRGVLTHQDFFAKNPNQGYCMAVAGPKVAKFRKTFAALVKD